jgi:hypothetical protein
MSSTTSVLRGSACGLGDLRAAVWKAAGMASPQSPSESDRREVAAWAADCAERVLVLFETEAPADEVAANDAFDRG